MFRHSVQYVNMVHMVVLGQTATDLHFVLAIHVRKIALAVPFCAEDQTFRECLDEVNVLVA